MFEARIQTVKVTFSPFSSEQMMTIGQVVLDSIRNRIKSVTDVTDSRARQLKPRYEKEKVEGRRVALTGGRKYAGMPFRDWTLRGRTLDSCKVKYASQERVTIGPTSEESGKIMTARNRLDHMWGLSPRDTTTLHAVVLATMRTHPIVQVQMQGYGKKVA